jgi:hypothetical protein
VIVTNAHMARGEESLLTVLSTGQQVEAKVVYIDADLDIALAKVDTPSGKSEIFVDDKFHGNTPATLRLPAGSHVLVLKFPRRADWRRTLEVLKSSKVSLKAALDPAS